MERIFISYRFTGEDFSELEKLMQRVCSAIDKAGNENYCSLWDAKMFEEKKFSGKQIMDYAFKEIDKSDIFLALVKSEQISEGMLIEAGYALAKKKKVILFINKSIKNHILKRLFDNVVEFNDFPDLELKLGELELK